LIKDEAGLVPRFFNFRPQIDGAQLQAHLEVVGGQLLGPAQDLSRRQKTALIEINDTEAAPRLGVLRGISAARSYIPISA